MKTEKLLRAALLIFSALLVAPGEAARESRISATKHNLSASGTGTTHSTTESQICVFCHTPHGADTSQAPLWNKTLANTAYTPYTSSSLDAATIQGVSAGQPLGSSKLCLSCHDGVMALGSVRAVRGQQNQTIGSGTEVTMPVGSGSTTGFTRLIGTDLTNDHPISVTYDVTLSDRDGELRQPTMSTGASGQTLNRWGTVFGVRGKQDSYKPLLPLEPTGANSAGQVQCTTCHDPHIRETDLTAERNIKFLRANRFQKAQPTNVYSAANDIVCLACHDKGGNSWAYSAHANANATKGANQTYVTAAADTREFPSVTSGAASNIKVWQAACLNCHDTHTISGARRLLREGTTGSGTPKAGGSSAIEETCYQCHSSSATSIITPLTTVPNIKDDFTLLARRMPITGTEVHDIGGNFSDATFVDCTGTSNKCGKDFIERRSLLGVGNLANRHAECTDCHNPHRVVRFKDFRGNPAGSLSGTPDDAGTHKHTDDATDIHSNIASGVLRGAWGVEPTYTSKSFHSLPSGYTVKRGDPGASTTAVAGDTYVTREYQICLKCHSDYGYSDDNVYPNGTNRPPLGGTGLTPVTRANDLRDHTRYTNQAKEFQAPSTHAVAVGSVSLGFEGGAGTSAAVTATNRYNHRSWHPVLAPTGRTGRSGAWIAPWNNSGTGGKAGRLGVQTMYCSDCHGSSTGTTASVIPTGGENGNPWGPHGSDNNFLLKGIWDSTAGEGNANTLCFKCHSSNAYGGTSGGTGFSTDRGDGHAVHSDRIDNPMKCNYCHVAVPHGWKNRGLLVNLLDVGPEVGLAAGTAVSYTNNVGYTKGPYYRNAFLRVISFPSGQWTESNCNGGSKSTMKTNCEQPP